jgi:hypothetical protein
MINSTYTVERPVSRPVAALIGIASVLPLVYLVYFVWHVTSLEPPGLMRFETLLSLHLLTVSLIVVVLTVVYLVMVYRSALVPQDRRTFWAVVLFMGNVFALPVFWYVFLWRPASSERAL